MWRVGKNGSDYWNGVPSASGLMCHSMDAVKGVGVYCTVFFNKKEI